MPFSNRVNLEFGSFSSFRCNFTLHPPHSRKSRTEFFRRDFRFNRVSLSRRRNCDKRRSGGNTRSTDNVKLCEKAQRKNCNRHQRAKRITIIGSPIEPYRPREDGFVFTIISPSSITEFYRVAELNSPR